MLVGIYKLVRAAATCNCRNSNVFTSSSPRSLPSQLKSSYSDPRTRSQVVHAKSDLTDWSWEEDKEMTSIFAEHDSNRRRYRAAAACKTLLPHLMFDKEFLLRSALWNPNLRIDAIFVDPGNRTNIIGLIDRRGIELVPLYKQTEQPSSHNPNQPSKYKSGKQLQFQRSIFESCAERDLDRTYRSSNLMIAASLNFRNSVESWL